MEERPKWRTLAPRKETVVISHLILDTVDSKADGIIEGSTGFWVVFIRTEIIDLPDANLVPLNYIISCNNLMAIRSNVLTLFEMK